jgi:serine/threonine-protein kinase
VTGGVDPRQAYALTQTGSSPSIVSPESAHKICPTCSTRHPEQFRVCPQDGTALVDADEVVGTTVTGTYIVTRILGEGGMGRVYEARHARIPSKRFALKMLHREFAEQTAILARFQREAEATSGVRSVHVVGVTDVNKTEDGRPFIISEFLEGKELFEHFLEVGRMPTGSAVRIIRQVCKGLVAAHAAGVVHRDMKPENVFLVGDPARPTAKIIDFGISRVDDNRALTQTGMIMGTPSYMAPEQARGERVDHRADIYAVGAILYHAVTGQRPFDRDDPSSTLMAVLSEDPPRPRSVNPEIPLELELVIERAMAKTVADRFQTMNELEQALAPLDPDRDGASPAGALTGKAAPAGPARLSARDTAALPRARPMLLLSSVAGAAGLAAGAITAIAAGTRIARDDGTHLTGTGAGLLALGVSFAIFGPTLIGVHLLRRRFGGDDTRVLFAARSIWMPVALGLGAYGFASLLVRFLETVVLCAAIGIAWPVWDLLLFLLGLGTAAGAIVAPRFAATR